MTRTIIALLAGAAASVHGSLPQPETPTTYREFMVRAAQALGAGPPRSIPVWLGRLVAGRGPVATLVRAGRTSNARLKAELGWAPVFPDSAEGIPAALTELRRRREGVAGAKRRGPGTASR